MVEFVWLMVCEENQLGKLKWEEKVAKSWRYARANESLASFLATVGN